MTKETPELSDSKIIELELLYGLLDDASAEELRKLVAVDAAAAERYNCALRMLNVWARASRIENRIDKERAVEVAFDPRSFENTAGFVFDAATSASDSFQVAEQKALTEDNQSEITRRKGVRRKKRTSTRSSRFYQLVPKSKSDANDDSTSSLKSFSKFWASIDAFLRFIKRLFPVLRVKRTFEKIREVFQRASFFQKTIVSFLLFGFIVASAVVWQEERLRRLFKEDYRVQTVFPSRLTRNAPQLISVVTTNLDSDPHRTTARFLFTDAATENFLFSHVENGDSIGRINYYLPSANDFPDVVRLSTTFDSRDVVTFSTDLIVQDPPKEPPLSSLFDDVTSGFFERSYCASVLREEIESRLNALDSDVDSEQSLASSSEDEENAERTEEAVKVGIYPEFGRFISGVPNRVAVWVPPRLLKDSDHFLLASTGKSTDLNIEFDKSGLGTFTFIPIEGEKYYLRNASRPISLLEARDPEGDGDATNSDGIELSYSKDSDAYFYLTKKVIDPGDPIHAIVNANAEGDFLLVVSQNGVLISQRILGELERKKKASIPLPDSVEGVLKVTLFRKDSENLVKTGETLVYRRGKTSDLNVKLSVVNDEERDDVSRSSRRLEIDLSRPARRTKKSADRSFSYDETPIDLEVFQTSSLEEASRVLTLNDVLGSCSETQLEGILATATLRDEVTPTMYDNWSVVQARARLKLRELRTREAKTSGRVVGFGLLCCIAFSWLIIFLTIFKSVPLFKGGLIVGLSVTLCFFLVLEQRALNYSSVLSEKLGSDDLANRPDEDINQAFFTTLKSDDQNAELGTRDTFADVVEITPIETKKIGLGKTNATFTSNDDERSYLVLRFNDGGRKIWRVLSVPQEIDKNGAEEM